MLLDTKHFGEINYNEEDVITFREGIPGFFHVSRFILITEGEDALFSWLQCIEDTDLAFVLMDVKSVLPDYKPDISPDSLKGIEENGGELICCNIVVVPEDISQMRVNLRAPVLINMKAKLGKQVVAQNEDYSVQYYIFDELNKGRQKQVAEC
jgi:flagellar assembly factor FliW